jgi:hypothetical protein
MNWLGGDGEELVVNGTRESAEYCDAISSHIQQFFGHTSTVQIAMPYCSDNSYCYYR